MKREREREDTRENNGRESGKGVVAPLPRSYGRVVVQILQTGGREREREREKRERGWLEECATRALLIAAVVSPSLRNGGNKLEQGWGEAESPSFLVCHVCGF